MMVRKELGGYLPKDPLEFAFISTVITSRNMIQYKNNTESRLQNLINRSR